MQGTSIVVTFHAVVPKLLWEWDDSSRMHIRFGHKDLGEWKHNTGVFMESRYMCTCGYSTKKSISAHFYPYRLHHENYHEMTCALSIQAELLKNPLEYKYVIFSPIMTGKDDFYEFLHSFAGVWAKDFNRCLSIDETKLFLAVGGNAEYVLIMLHVHNHSNL